MKEVKLSPMRVLASAAVLVLALILAGCAGAATAQKAPAETNRVTMAKSYRFVPAEITVHVGDTVTWTNDDNFTHDVHVLGAANWRSQPVRPGESVSYTFSQPGEYSYQCDFHPQNMQGKVIVAPRVNVGGTYNRIENSRGAGIGSGAPFLRCGTPAWQ